MKPNHKPSPNINMFAWHGSRRKKSKELSCPNCPSHLNIKYVHANDCFESTDGAISRKVSCNRCETFGWTCEQCETWHVYPTMNLLKLHDRRFHSNVSVTNDNNEEDDFTLSE